MFSSYQNAVKIFKSLRNMPVGKGGADVLESDLIYQRRAQFLLDRLGNPERRLRFVHVSGTAGKGTTASLIHAGFTAASIPAGLFTSPETTTMIENTSLGESLIAPDAFARLCGELFPLVEQSIMDSPYGRPTSFEIELALALAAFSRAESAWAVVEVGCGGRYDATNVIPNRDICVITNIGWDHTETLGKTLKKIARDKVGIVKKGCTLFTAETRPHLLKIFAEHCRDAGARMIHVVNEGSENHTLARAVLRYCGVSEAAIAHGFEQARLPCRFEIMQESPLVILDGSHNPLKISFLAKELKRRDIASVHCVFGVKDTKDIARMMRILEPYVAKWYFTHSLDPTCRSVDLRAARACATRPNQIFLDPNRALDCALHTAGQAGVILVTGSFHHAGEIRTRWISEEMILESRSPFPRTFSKSFITDTINSYDRLS